MKFYKNICLVDTPCALSYYLLKMTMDDIRKTLFIVGDSVDKRIVDQLPHTWAVRNQSAKSDWIYMAYLKFIKFFKCCSFPFIHIYAQDHLYIASSIIGSKDYVNIPDGPDCYFNWEHCPWQPQKCYGGSTLKRRLKFWMSRGKMYDMKYGMNNQCINRWVATKKDLSSIYLIGKNHEYLDAAQLWNDASHEKQALIKKIFGISEALLDSCKQIECLILTQPLREDCHLTDEEHKSVFAETIVNNTNVGIKTHPRDKFDYKKYFDNVYVIETYAPMQLLNYMGFAPKKAVTVCSTSISAMPDDTEKIYLGTKINSKVYQIYGDLCNS